MNAQVADPVARAQRLYFMISSKPLTAHTTHYVQIVDLIRIAHEKDAVSLIMKDPSFLNNTIRSWGVRYLTAEKSTHLVLNDSLAMILGLINDNRDFRELLTGNYIYSPLRRLGFDRPVPNSNDTYNRLEAGVFNLQDTLERIEPQWDLSEFKEASGILTSRWWSEKYYTAGTNRRGVVGALEVLACRPIESWKTPYLPTDWIRRDIPRDPSGDVRIFQTECRSCHAPMDALAGAFAYFDYTDGLHYLDHVAPKYLRLPNVYPEGFVTTNNTWLNYLTLRDQLDFGWRSPTSGSGIEAFGQMIAQSTSFSRCVAMRTLKYFCSKNYSLNDSVVNQYATSFEQDDQYRMKDFISRIVTSKECE